MHAESVQINIDEVIESGPVGKSSAARFVFISFILVGMATFVAALSGSYSHALLWGAYYSNLNFFMGLAAGGVMISVITQIVRATWISPIRRIAEANVAFLPWAWLLLLATWPGREYLFPWARGPMPGKEWWMQPGFVYARFAVLLALLFFLMWRFVRMSLRSDVGSIMEQIDKRDMEPWRKEQGFFFNFLSKGWKGSETEILGLQRKMSFNAPIVLLAYAVVYSLFAFEMVMGMDPYWISNLFGAFIFVGNVYMGWVTIGIIGNILRGASPVFSRIFQSPTRWDLGKLTFAFCMLWGYMFFSQFLPQWYGNLPEETQWLILRTRDWELPWIRMGWVVFPMCFIIPFVCLLSRDVKKTAATFNIVGAIILIGMWLERYIIIMPNISPERIPLGVIEFGLFLGFLGIYGFSVQAFLSKVPMVPVSHPQTHGSVEW